MTNIIDSMIRLMQAIWNRAIEEAYLLKALEKALARMHSEQLREKLYIRTHLMLIDRAKCKRMDTSTRRIAKQRVQTLFRLAREIFRDDPDLAQRYVDNARKIAMAAKIRLPTEYRRQVCRHCKSFILPGVNCRVRIRQRREPHVAITCLNCGKQIRIPLAVKEEKPTP